MSNTLDFTLYYKWKDVCHELEIVNDMLLNLKWYEYFIRGDKIKLLEKNRQNLILSGMPILTYFLNAVYLKNFIIMKLISL